MEPTDYLRSVPQQARSAARVESILEACGRILEAGSIDGLSITAVAGEAGIPPASIYDYFADARSLLAAFVARCFEQTSEYVAAMLAPASTGTEAIERVNLALISYCDLYRSDIAFRTAISASQADDDLATISFEDSKKNAALLRQMLAPFVDPDRHQELDDRAFIAVSLSGAFARMVRMAGPEEAERLMRTYVDAFISNLVER